MPPSFFSEVSLPERVLIIRLSSFGDVILSLSALDHVPASWQVDWLTASEYAGLFIDNQKIKNLKLFDRRSKLRAWVSLASSLSDEGYTKIVDLHGSLRTRILKLVIVVAAIHRRLPIPSFFLLKRKRLRRSLFLLLKKATPLGLRPPRKREEIRDFFERNFGTSEFTQIEPLASRRTTVSGKVGLVPSSAWRGKEWGVERFFDLSIRLIESGRTPVVLGLATDQAARALVERLTTSPKSCGCFIDGTGGPDLNRMKALISSCERVISGDTGLAHLSESLGVPVTVVFGPTHPDLGFGPSLYESRAVTSELWCSPCSKDGSQCFRIKHRFLCMRRISVEDVLSPQ